MYYFLNFYGEDVKLGLNNLLSLFIYELLAW